MVFINLKLLEVYGQCEGDILSGSWKVILASEEEIKLKRNRS